MTNDEALNVGGRVIELLRENERLRAERDALRACGYESIAMYRRCRDERDALRRCLTMDGTDVVGFPSDFNVAVMPTMRYDALMAERDALLELVGDLDAHEGAEGRSERMRERINAALAKEADRG
jgi:hypothetical protein